MKTQIFLYLFLVTIIARHHLTFSDEGHFKILQLTDLHLGETEEIDAKTVEFIRTMINMSKPDIVLVTGDSLSGNYWKMHGKPQGYFKKAWDKWTLPFRELKVPYAYLLGNHDDEADLTRREIMKIDMTHEYSLSNMSEPELSGISVYTLKVHSGKNPGKVVTNLWVFDSGAHECEGVPGYGCVERDQVAWYNNESEEFRKNHGTEVHHLAFLHIPISEYLTLYNKGEFRGLRGEYIGCPQVNTGFFESIKKNKDITGIFVGHDHLNDMEGWLDGVELTYGRKSGYGSYGPEAHIIRGGRVIELKETVEKDGKVKIERHHYILNELGEMEAKPKKRKVMKGGEQGTCISPHSYLTIYEKLQPADETFVEETEWDRVKEFLGYCVYGVLLLIFLLKGPFSQK